MSTEIKHKLFTQNRFSQSYSKLNNSLLIPKITKNEPFIFAKTSSVAAWKAKRMRQKAEEAKKMQEEVDLIHEKMKKIKENRGITKGFIEERKNILESISYFQNKINDLICDIQNIRKNNENLHQESMKLTKKTHDLIASLNLNFKEQSDIQKELDNIDKEIIFAEKQNKLMQDKVWGIREKIQSSEDVCYNLNHQIKFIESEKLSYLEATWKNQKKIKLIQKDIQLYLNIKRRSSPS